MIHDALRQRLIRAIESLPEAQVYQVLDYIEFLESKHGRRKESSEASPLQRLAENIEDGLRRRSVSPGTIREAFQVISAADRVISGVSQAGKRILDDLGQPKGDSRMRPSDDRTTGAKTGKEARDQLDADETSRSDARSR